MCNRYRLTAKQAEVAATFGIRPPCEVDETFPTGDIFPTGKKTPFYGTVVVQDGDERRIERSTAGHSVTNSGLAAHSSDLGHDRHVAWA